MKIILGQPAGSGSDPMVRGLATHLSAAFGQPFIVDNRPGAGGNVAAAAVAQSSDDHTLGVVLGGPTTTAKLLTASLPYDPARDFKPISLLNRTPFVLTVHPATFPGGTFADWIDRLRAQPGKFSYASIGPGTVTHLAMEEIKAKLGVDIVHVPYRGFPQATLDLIEGRVHAMFNIMSAAAEHATTGRIAALMQTGATRMTPIKDVPTLQEAGLPTQPFFGWSGVIAPSSWPNERANAVSKIIRDALRTDPAARGGLDKLGAEIVGSGPAELASLQGSESERWGGVIRSLGLKPV
ncbi:Bug family tripartite tricarboxylate transporter substrate binding protein [Variibacter gotjawalensis]|uniref:Bug family tripartite tricarboxylate transporter substrate binding protein n=1 Tax=Variibacter gotjawalensis TaxID=1333996 RepID=UPI0012FE2807|nr:tripartite tricarboxylate transporter substrate-binding protein [Variibacter gotjawalensis]NIK49899.1 tripartite-type tricarboxylate transporter receptor subunit TctC [Variibacter gotjawalensis]